MDTKKLIAAAVEPRRAAAIARAKESAATYAANLIAKLVAANGDLNVVAPRPKSTMSRAAYVMAKNLRARFESLTNDANPKFGEPGYARDMERHYGRAPDLRVADDAKIAAFVELAGQEADAGFDSYIAKLTGKVNADATSEVDAAELDSGALWSFSHLTIRRADGTTERWRTQMILNHSVLGTLFNQWPTRRVK